jgi:uncharacterized protein YfaS (alpha-2-macroglobulin family)
MYKPNETVSVKGYLRVLDFDAKNPDARVPRFYGGSTAAPAKLNWTVHDARGQEIGKGQCTLNAFGAFNMEYKLPDNANLGNTRITFTLAPTDKPLVCSCTLTLRLANMLLWFVRVACVLCV